MLICFFLCIHNFFVNTIELHLYAFVVFIFNCGYHYVTVLSWRVFLFLFDCNQLQMKSFVLWFIVHVFVLWILVAYFCFTALLLACNKISDKQEPTLVYCCQTFTFCIGRHTSSATWI